MQLRVLSRPRRYEGEVDGATMTFVPVSTVLNCLSRPGLTHWAARCAAQCAVRALTMFPYDDPERVVADSCKAHLKESRKALRIGSNVHALISEHWSGEGGVRALSEQEACCWRAWKHWREAYPPDEVLAVERPVASLPHGYAGTPDLVCRYAETRTLVDFKTGGIYYEAYLQMGAYFVALDGIEEAHLVQLSKLGKGFTVCVLDADLLRRCGVAWLRLLDYWKVGRELEREVPQLRS